MIKTLPFKNQCILNMSEIHGPTGIFFDIKYSPFENHLQLKTTFFG